MLGVKQSECLLFGSPDMMGHPELVTETAKAELGPLIPIEGLEQLQSKYVQSVRVSRSASVLQIYSEYILYLLLKTLPH